MGFQLQQNMMTLSDLEVLKLLHLGNGVGLYLFINLKLQLIIEIIYGLSAVVCMSVCLSV